MSAILFGVKREQSIKGDKLANSGFQTNVNTFFKDRRLESKNSDHICVQTFMITFFLWEIKF